MPPPTNGFAPPFGGPPLPSTSTFIPISGGKSAKKPGLFKFSSGINLLWVILVGILAGFVLDVRSKCDSKDPEDYQAGTHAIFIIAIVVLMIAALILLYDLNEYIRFGKS